MSVVKRQFAGRLILATLIVLGLLPLLAGIGRMIMRFADIGATPEMLADTARYFEMPVVVVVHVVGGCLFTLVGALQFSPALRRGSWHRRSGRLMVVAGLAAAFSALWLTQFYPHLETEGPLLYWFRLAAGLGMIGFLLQGYRSARQRRFDAHRGHMTRAYALGLGASTQMLIGIPWMLLFGPPSPIVSDLLLGSGWAINLAVAQWVLRRPVAPASRIIPAGA